MPPFAMKLPNLAVVAANTLKSVARITTILCIAAAASPTLAATADLVINIDDSPDPGPAGGVFTYTVRVDNNGPDATTGVTLTDTLPASASFVSAVPTQGSCTYAAPTVTCGLGSLTAPNPTTANATVVIKVTLPISGVYTSTFSATSANTDPNTSNNLNIPEDTTVRDAADMSLAVVGPGAAVAAGAAYTYQLTASNGGPNDLDADATRTITFDVPSGACVTSKPSGSGWTCAGPSVYPACGGTITCSRTGALLAGNSDPVLGVSAAANVAGTISAEFDVESSLLDGNLANNTAVADVVVSGGSSDISIKKTASPTTVAENGNVTYTLTPHLNGGEKPGTLANHIITITDVLPAGLTFMSVTPQGSWTCAYDVPTTTLTCSMPGPYTGANYTDMPAITVVATVASTGSIANSATIGAPESDPVPANNTGSVTITGSNSADLRVTKSVSLATVVPGSSQPFVFTITPRNNGPLAMVAGQVVTITDNLPAGFTVTTQPSGTNWTCDTLTLPAVGPFIFTCTRTLTATFNANTNFNTITFSAYASTTGDLTNQACGVLAGAGPVDDVPANDCGPATVKSTTTSANLNIQKVGPGVAVNAGDDLTYTITVGNAGPDTATNVVVTDVLASLIPANGLVSASVSSGACNPAGPASGASITVNCTIPTLVVGDSAVVTIVVKPTITLTGIRNNTATVNSTDVGDPVRSDNTSSAAVTITAVADMQVQKSAGPNPVHGGAPLTYTLTAKNNGPSTALSVNAKDTLPANAVFLSLLSVSGAGVCTIPAAGDLGGVISCTWASIANGSQETAKYVLRPLASAQGGNVVNDATVTTTTIDSNSTNNEVQVATPVIAPLLDILVNKVDSVDPVALGGTTRYTITINNQGPSFGTHLHIVDTFPSQSPTATFSYQGNLAMTPAAFGTCNEPGTGAISGTLDCTFPGIEAGQTVTVMYDMRAESVVSGVSGTGFNTVNVSVDETETQTTNNNAIESTTTRRTADLGLVKNGPASIAAGATIPYVLTITNHGPNTSMGATVEDVLPPGISFVSASSGCTHAGATVTCTLGTLALNASATLNISASVSSPYTGTLPLTNSASVTTVNEIDPVPGNNSSTTPADVTPAPPAPNEPAIAVPILGWQQLLALSLLIALAVGMARRGTRR